MRTLIRASQLHPDVSGIVRSYTQNLYPNYSDIYGVSGISVTRSGDYCIITAPNSAINGIVNQINGVTGLVNITGVSGIYSQVSGNTVYLGITGAPSVTRLNTLSGNINLVGTGTVDVWPINATTIVISGMTVTGYQNVYSFVSGGAIRLSVSAVTKLNNVSGATTLVGAGGIAISTSGQNIYVDASALAGSGVKSIAGVVGDIVFGTGNDISIAANPFTNQLTFSYTGHGVGTLNTTYSGANDYSWMGNSNRFYVGTGVFCNGDSNTFNYYSNISTMNARNSVFSYCSNSTFINTSGSTFNGVSGSTFINGTVNSSFPHPNSFGVGNSVANSYFANINLKAVLSGQQMKAMKVAKTSYSGIYVPTGAALVGHIDYAAAKYNITDFLASFDIVSGGIYGRKHFIAQRGTNNSVIIKDEADMFGGTDNYGIFLSGGQDECFYIMASGNLPDSVIFQASVQYSQFIFDTSYE